MSQRLSLLHRQLLGSALLEQGNKLIIEALQHVEQRPSWLRSRRSTLAVCTFMFCTTTGSMRTVEPRAAACSPSSA